MENEKPLTEEWMKESFTLSQDLWKRQVRVHNLLWEIFERRELEIYASDICFGSLGITFPVEKRDANDEPEKRFHVFISHAKLCGPEDELVEHIKRELAPERNTV